MADVTYTDPSRVTRNCVTAVPAHRQSASGYGDKIPTRHMIEYDGRWRRVYAMAYGNGATVYIVVKGANLVLDVDTQNTLGEQ